MYRHRIDFYVEGLGSYGLGREISDWLNSEVRAGYRTVWGVAPVNQLTVLGFLFRCEEDKVKFILRWV